jgi:hypothetical protein
VDTDGGINYYAAGSCQGYNSDFTQWFTVNDYCSSLNVYECYCGGDDRINGQFYSCPAGCSNNRCNPTTTTTLRATTTTLKPYCTEGDSGAAHTGPQDYCQDNKNGVLQTYWEYCLSATERRGYYCDPYPTSHCTQTDYVCWNGYGSGYVGLCSPRNHYCYVVAKGACNNMCRDAGAALRYGNYGTCGATSIAWGDQNWWDIPGATDCTGGNPYCHCRK